MPLGKRPPTREPIRCRGRERTPACSNCAAAAPSCAAAHAPCCLPRRQRGCFQQLALRNDGPSMRSGEARRRDAAHRQRHRQLAPCPRGRCGPVGREQAA
eukprot:1768572-Heterocapsa_arctica.AAC.1